MQAYYEWMPVRDPLTGRTREAFYRTFEFGNLATLSAIETRLLARSKQMSYEDYGESLLTAQGRSAFEADRMNEARTLMGPVQMQVIADDFGASKAAGKPWRLLANQIIMAKTATPDLTDAADAADMKPLLSQSEAFAFRVSISNHELPLNLDAWDGYPAERERFYSALRSRGVSDMIVLTGDTHEFWANRLTDKAGRSMGVELGTSGVTSPGSGSYLGAAGARFSRELVAQNKDVHINENKARGYILLTLTPDRARSEFIALSTIESSDYAASPLRSFNITKSGDSLVM